MLERKFAKHLLTTYSNGAPEPKATARQTQQKSSEQSPEAARAFYELAVSDKAHVDFGRSSLVLPRGYKDTGTCLWNRGTTPSQSFGPLPWTPRPAKKKTGPAPGMLCSVRAQRRESRDLPSVHPETCPASLRTLLGTPNAASADPGLLPGDRLERKRTQNPSCKSFAEKDT